MNKYLPNFYSYNIIYSILYNNYFVSISYASHLYGSILNGKKT